MAFPLVALMLGSMAASGAANLYSQYNQRKLYRGMSTAYKNLDTGYRQYLATQGKTINPDRAWSSYYGQFRKAQTNLENSYLGSVGTAFGTAGAGLGLSRIGRSGSKSLYTDTGRTSRWL